MANVHLEQGRAHAAARVAARACELSPERDDLHEQRGFALHQSGDINAAIDAYHRAIHLNPSSVSARVELARALLTVGQAEGVVEICDELFRRDSGNRCAVAFKSIALAELGQHDNACQLLALDSLIRPFKIGIPTGFEDINAFN